MKITLDDANDRILTYLIATKIKEYLFYPKGRFASYTERQKHDNHQNFHGDESRIPFTKSWNLSGGFIEEYQIALQKTAVDIWRAKSDNVVQYGESALIAICKCAIHAKCGTDEFEVPDEFFRTPGTTNYIVSGGRCGPVECETKDEAWYAYTYFADCRGMVSSPTGKSVMEFIPF